MYEFGPHVIVSGVRPEISCTFPIVADVYKHYDLLCIITSITDRSHSRGSLHYTGNAYDIYWNPEWSLRIDVRLVELKIFRKLNGFPKSAEVPPEYDVVFEGDHFHIEHQPKVSNASYSSMVDDWVSGL
jgi:hypothetical protein